ncbi:MAG: MaoC family dehydratase N-terminal domain-containing protein [Chrysiogenetes bacterium]|nr:MaoC family dehydratase N-terminal domain-containing protein [Chrysiogenetes bacterium]
MADQVYFEDVQEGTEIPTLTKDEINRVQLVKYAGASGDYNPLHYDEDFAKAAGMPNGCIAHGMLSMGFVGQLLSDWISPAGKVKEFGVRFTSMTDMKDKVICKGRVVRTWQENGENLAECEVTSETNRGNVTTKGRAVVALPSRG